MAELKVKKYVSSLPGILEANTIYFVKISSGFDIYITNDIGTVVAYPLNHPTNISGSSTINFTGMEDAKQVTISNTSVLTTSKILLNITVPNTRDLDEMEMEAFTLATGNIVNSTSFDVIATSLKGGAEGNYQINYQIL